MRAAQAASNSASEVTGGNTTAAGTGAGAGADTTLGKIEVAAGKAVGCEGMVREGEGKVE